MSKITEGQQRAAQNKSRFLLALLVARIISYTASLAYLRWPGVQVNWLVLGIWFWATFLSRFLGEAVVARIYGPSPARENPFGKEVVVAGVITLVFLVGHVAGLW